MLKSKPGIIYAEQLTARDGDAYIYNIESESDVDIRKSLFYTLSEKNWPLVGMEPLGMNLEDIFVAIVDQSSPEEQTRNYKRERQNRSAGKSPKQASREQEVARNMRSKKSSEDTKKYSALFDEDDD